VPSYAVCDTLMLPGFLETSQGLECLYGFLFGFARDQEWQLAVDTAEGYERVEPEGIMIDRYFSLAEESSRLWDWLDYLLESRGADAFDPVPLANGAVSSFEAATCAAASGSPGAMGIVTRIPARYSFCVTSHGITVKSRSVAEKEIEMSKRGSTFNISGQGIVVGGRDVSNVCVSLEQSGQYEVANVLRKMADVVNKDGTDDTKDQFSAFAEEMAKAKPATGVLKGLWSAISTALPQLVAIAESASKFKALLGLG
jgi:hypothetical protein